MNKISGRFDSSLATVLALLLLAACASTTQQKDVAADPQIVTSLNRYHREYVLVPGDIIEIAVYRNAEVSRTVTIGPDGNISLPLLDQIKVSGLTITQLDEMLTQKLGARLVNPEVTIIHANPMEPMVYVYGDVRAVLPVPLRMARTLAQAIAMAGGVTRDAALRDVALIRLNDDGYLKMIRMNEATRGQIGPYLAYQNTPLQPDDLIVVPESARSIAGRFITDFITEPLSAVNMILTPYFQFKLINDLNN